VCCFLYNSQIILLLLFRRLLKVKRKILTLCFQFNTLYYKIFNNSLSSIKGLKFFTRNIFQNVIWYSFIFKFLYFAQGLQLLNLLYFRIGCPWRITLETNIATKYFEVLLEKCMAFPDDRKLFLLPRHKFGPCLHECKT
jgi:hypothetical protein